MAAESVVKFNVSDCYEIWTYSKYILLWNDTLIQLTSLPARARLERLG